jgi:membrane protease YdiL (CAAX protease family)
MEWALLGFSVMLAAPLWEELLFRGLLPALCRKLRGSGGHAAMTLALMAAMWLRRNEIAEALGKDFLTLLLAAMPVLFVVAMVPLYALVYWRSRTENGPVVFGTALLFAAVHSTWPTPVALFILALGLGWLAVWTRSLLAPIIVHALFNALSFVLLYYDLFTG